MKSFEIEELVGLKDGIVITDKGEENIYFQYKNKLGHIENGYFKFSVFPQYKLGGTK